MARDSFDLNAIGVTRRRFRRLSGEKHIQARCSASIPGLPARSFPVVVRLQALCGLAIIIFCEDSFLAPAGAPRIVAGALFAASGYGASAAPSVRVVDVPTPRAGVPCRCLRAAPAGSP